MKLNNGKGWEAMKAHPSQAHLHHNAVPNSSARELHGANRASKTPIPPGRLEAELPKPGATRQPQQSAAQRQSRRDHYGNQDYAKRRSTGGDLAAPEGSTAAQFANSNANLPRMSSQQQQQQPNRQVSAQQQAAQRSQAQQPQPEQKQGVMSKILKVLCCG